MKTFKLLSGSLLLLLLAMSCTKEEKAEAGVHLRFDLNDEVVSYRSPGDLQFTGGTIAIGEVEFEGELTNGTEIEIEFDGYALYAFGAGDPVDYVLDIPAGIYEELSLEIDLEEEDGLPSIVAEGIYENNEGLEIPVRFEYSSDEDFEVEARQVEITPDDAIFAEVTFDPHLWFANVSFEMLEAAAIGTDGVMLISENSNEQIYERVAAAIDLAAEADID